MVSNLKSDNYNSLDTKANEFFSSNEYRLLSMFNASSQSYLESVTDEIESSNNLEVGMRLLEQFITNWVAIMI